MFLTSPCYTSSAKPCNSLTTLRCHCQKNRHTISYRHNSCMSATLV